MLLARSCAPAQAPSAPQHASSCAAPHLGVEHGKQVVVVHRPSLPRHPPHEREQPLLSVKWVHLGPLLVLRSPAGAPDLALSLSSPHT